MRRFRFLPWVMVAALATRSAGADQKPDFTGIWRLAKSKPAQVILIEQMGAELRLFEFFGDRPAVFHGAIDGRPHPETVDGRRSEFLARWQGDALFFETRRPAEDSGGTVDVRHLLRLARGGEVMTVKRTSVSPRPGTEMQKWERQDAVPQGIADTGFDYRRQLDKGGAELSGAEGHRVRGAVAYAFNDVPAAERELLPLLRERPASRYREEARRELWDLYVRNGMMKQALPYSLRGDRPLYAELAQLPEVRVLQRAPAHIRITHDQEGRLMLPVALAGREARYMVDTGSSISLLRRSEAQRLGLKVEKARKTISDGNINFSGFLAIAPEVAVGETRLANVPFWVVPDSRMDWPDVHGILGMDLLLQLETLRWSADGEGETGFPGAEKNIREANLCFWNEYPLLEFSAHGQNQMILFLDTGSNLAKFFPAFAARNLDLLAKGTRTIDHWHAHGAKGESVQVTLPELTVQVGGSEAKLSHADVLLEWPFLPRQFHGTMGINLLNGAQRVTLDLKAMRLTIE